MKVDTSRVKMLYYKKLERAKHLNNVVVGTGKAMTREKSLDANGKKIKTLECLKCGYRASSIVWADEGKENYVAARAEATLGHYGPNGNGYNYWCPKDEYRMKIVGNSYSALDSFFGYNQ